MMTSSLRLVSVGMILWVNGVIGLGAGQAADTGSTKPRIEVAVDEQAGSLDVRIEGRIAFTYRFGPTVDLPHFDPFASASGRAMTIKITEPYPHHRSFWVADERVHLAGQAEPANLYSALYSGVVNPDVSRWPTAPYQRRVSHVAFENLVIDGDTATFDEKLTWFDKDVALLDEIRHYRIHALGDGEYLLDFAFSLQANYGDVTIQRDNAHYAIPYIRMNEVFNVEKGGGTITNSEGGSNQSGTDGKPALWVDYSAPLAGGVGFEGLACLIHPSQAPPHQWLTRNYGTFGPRAAEAFHNTKFTLRKNESFDQRVGLLVHRGDCKTGNVAERYKAYGSGEL